LRYQRKYRNKKTVVDGITFDSKKEAARYKELKMMEKAGLIEGLQRQVKFVLIPAQREPDTFGPRGGRHKGRLIEREHSYYADFTYYENGEFVVEDVKGVRTDVYRLKKALMLKEHGIRIKET